jgi:uncharacterized DUF497 family protein
MEFRWNAWNIDHIAEHGVEPEEAEAVVRNARKPYPRYHADEKWLVRGRGSGGRLLQVIFVVDEDDKIFVIHSRPLTDKEKRKFRKGK